MLKKSLLMSCALVGLAAMSLPASAAVLYSGSTTAASPSGWTPLVDFSSPSAGEVEVTVTDCCYVGDYYATYLNGTYLGTTPYEPEYGSNSGYPLSSGTFLGTVVAGANNFQLLDQTSFYLPAGVSVTISTIPEASTWAMMMLGFGGLAMAGYRGARKRPALPA